MAAAKETPGFLSRRLPRRQFVENTAIAAGGIAAGGSLLHLLATKADIFLFQVGYEIPSLEGSGTYGLEEYRKRLKLKGRTELTPSQKENLTHVEALLESVPANEAARKQRADQLQSESDNTVIFAGATIAETRESLFKKGLFIMGIGVSSKTRLPDRLFRKIISFANPSPKPA